MKINIIDYFSQTVKACGPRVAVVEGESSISFDDLNILSIKLASKIHHAAGVVNRPIAVFLPKSISSIVANIAISYSGNIYMNLDINAPKERIKSILELIKPVLVITDSKRKSLIEDLIDESDLINYDFLMQSDEIALNYLEIKSHLIDTDPYCIINTSGSTGTPKGVVLSHKNFIDFIEWSTKTFKFSDQKEIVGSLSPIIFDIYSYELCLLMSKGITLVLIPDSFSAFPIKILELLQKTNVSFIFWVPTIMVNIANMKLLENVNLDCLKLIWFAGEVFPTKQFNYWRRNLKHSLFVNLYGPIEITLDCSYFIVDRVFLDDEPIPIGFPCKNTEIIILDESNQRVKNGGEGELCVRGSSLAMGYYNNPELTKAVFVQNPLNNSFPELIYRTGDIVTTNDRGEMIYKGRRDTLIKYAGYRIELSEIEHVVINRLKLVKNGCAVYDHIEKKIIFIYEQDAPISDSEFRKKISTILPRYMVPTKYLCLEKLPMNPNGKIDRLKLKEVI